ncbi:MAG: HAD-IIB family hydrolase [Leptolyngbyaceae bacterium]|nr:HAD-IIB family hydrolase [Leptolyngbyaceae bacterium]
MAMSVPQSTKLLVATDLDATLLDHQTYRYDAALPAIDRLRAHHCPIIFNSSKTQAEQTVLRKELSIEDPFILENGAAVVIPPGCLGHADDAAEPEMNVFGLPYAKLVDVLARLRERHGFAFRGFSDLTAEELAELTGLSIEGAIAAKQRSGTEPLYWEDSEAAYQTLVDELADLGLQTTQGGRFRHVMGNTDKGSALKWLVERYQKTFPDVQWTVVALGDSPNDLPMLRVADIGVLIPNPHRVPFDVTGVARLLRPQQPGPEGWAEAMQNIIQHHL